MQDTCESNAEVEERLDGPTIVSKPEKLKAKYEKLGNAGIEGTSFQIDLLTVFFLNAVKRAENWHLSTENKQGGKFDDVVFESPKGDVLLQAKHKQNEKKITLQDLLSTNSKHSDFSLPQYFFSYQSIKNNFNIQTVIICTNAKIQTDTHTAELVAAQNLNTQHLLYFHGIGTVCYTFKDRIKLELKTNLEKYLEENLQGKNVSPEIISDENIDDYLSHLQLVVSYPCGRDMEKILENNISHLNWSRNLDEETCLKFIRKKIEDWYKEKKGKYLTQENGKAYFCEIRRKLFYDGLKRYGVCFENNGWPFSSKFLHIIPRQTYVFNAIKIFQALEGANLNDTLFLNVDEPRIFQELVIDAFEIPQYTHLLILTSEGRQAEIVGEMCDKIVEILNSCEYKKVILIGREDDRLAKGIKSTHASFYKAVFDNVVFTDFTEETREEFRQKARIVFQGEKVCLNELCVTDNQLNHLLRPDILEKLANDEKIDIGSELFQDVENFYIPRSFTQDGYILTEQDMCQLDNTLPKVILISDFAGMGKSVVLTKLSELLKKKYPHLWVIRIDLNMYTKYLWHCTKNLATVNILDFLNSVEGTKLKNSFEMELFSLDGRIVLMLDGVDEICPDYTEVVFQLLTDCTANPSFRKIFVTTRPHLHKKIEDVLDVSSFSLKPFSTENQIDFIKRYLETRADLQDDIKRAKCKVYAECLVARMAQWLNEEKNTFAGIPLQTRMLAEVFQERALSSEDNLEDWEGFKEFLTSREDVPKLPRKIDLVRLYQMFVDRKRDVFIYEKGNLNGNLLAEEGVNKIFNECQAYHRALALQIVLDKDRTKVFNLHSDKYENNPELNILKIGIVQKVNENIQFIHRTFAEYFVAEALLVELKHKPQRKDFQTFFVKELLQKYEFSVVRTFLDSLIKNESSLPRETFESYHFLICTCVSEKSTNSDTFLHVLAEEGCPHILRFLIESLKYTDFKNPIYRIYAKLRSQPIDLNVIGSGDETALHKAARNGHSSVVQLLLEQGATVDTTDSFDFKPIHYAAQEGHLKVVEVLTDNGKEIDCIAVQKAAEKGHLKVVRYLIEKGVNVKEAPGCLALHFAAFSGKTDVVKFLLDHGVDVNAKNSTGSTALHFAASCGRLNVVELLLERGSDVNVANKYGATPLHGAAEEGALDVAKALIENGADPYVRDAKGRTALNYAALNLPQPGDNYSVIVKLGDGCASINDSPNNCLEVFIFLLEKGVQVNFENAYERNAMVAASEKGLINLADYAAEGSVLPT